MATQKVSISEFAAKIKAKYPVYANVPDDELAQRVIAKYPEYAKSVEQGPVKPELPPLGKGESIDAPSGLLEKARAIYQGNAPEWVQSLFSNVNKLGQASGLDQPMTAYAPAGAIAKSAAQSVVPVLEKSAAKNYMNILAPTSSNDVIAAEKLAPKLAQTKITAISRGSLQKKAQQGMEYFGPKAAKAFENAPPVPLQKIKETLEGVKDRFLYVKGTKVVPSGSEGLNNFFSSVIDDLAKLSDEGGNVQAQIVDNYIDKINEGLVMAEGGFRANVSPKTIGKMYKQTAGALRGMLDKPNPKAAEVNAMYSIHAKTNYFLEKYRKARIKARSAALTGSSKGFGALIERTLPRYVRELPQAITGIFDSVPWNTMSGATKQLIADALASGNTERAQRLMEEAVEKSAK